MASTIHVANRVVAMFLAVVLLFVCLLPPIALSSQQLHKQRDRDLSPAPLETGIRSWFPAKAQWPGPDYSPFSKIAFQSYRDDNWEIYVAQGDGSNAVRLTNHPANDVTPRLKRGGSQIAFASNRTGNYEIFVVNSDGSQLYQLTQNAANDNNPAWSPDGSKIAFNSYRDGQSEIYIMNADSSNQTRLTTDNSYDGEPTWSPDGTRLAFTSQRAGGYAIWVMNANGSNPVRLSTQALAENPVWSPDGTKIGYDADGDNDGWQELFVMKADGSNQRQLYDHGGQTDMWAGGWSPDSLYLSYASVDWVNYQGNWYWTASHMGAMEEYDLSHIEFGGSSADWPPDWTTTDITAPSTHVIAPRWAQSVTLNIIGTDVGGAGISYYKIQYRDGAGGVWTDLPQTMDTTIPFPYHEYGHIYYFRSSATDRGGNVEPYPGGDGDAQTSIYKYVSAGMVRDNRDQPVAIASITTSPSAMNPGFSRHDGLFDLYLASDGPYTLTVTRNGFGAVPPMSNVPPDPTLPTVYLPPLDDQITDGYFESGNLSAWNPSGANGNLTPTITSMAYTGVGAVVLGATVPTDTIGHSTIAQTISVSPTIVSGTLSLFYRVYGNPFSDTLTAYVIGLTDTLTFTLPLPVAAWTHTWFDVSTWNEPTATVRIDYAVGSTLYPSGVILDEITWGSIGPASPTVFLPLVRR